MGTDVGPGGVKRSGREFEHSRPHGTEFKNEWCYVPTPKICLLDVDGNSFSLLPVTECAHVD
jgi:hypothetical protein